MQRLFSAFPNSWPGRGLLLQRTVTATFLLSCAELREAHQFAYILPRTIGACAAIFLFLGLWTPIFGTLMAVVEVWIALSYDGSCEMPLMLATSGVALAMIGPGAWSIDARVFGRKHIEIRRRQDDDLP